MRNLSRAMVGLMAGAAMLAPIAAQAQEQGRDRGGWQRGGGDGGARAGGMQRGGDGPGRGGGWQRGNGGEGVGGRAAGMNNDARRQAWEQRRAAATADRSAGMNDDARRQAWEQRRAAATADRAARAQTGDAARQWREGRTDATRADNNREEARRRWVEARTGAARQNDNDNERRRWDRTRDRATAGVDDRRDRDRDGRNWNRDGRDWNRDGRNDDRNRRWTTDRRDWDRDGRSDRRDRWDRNWRNDRRYAWQDYRTRNRHVYRLPRYVSPRAGYSYRRWYPGHRFDSFYYSSSYWISDPWFYRLPPAYGDYRWVRYYDDAVLVDVYTGEIIDIIYSFFF